MGASVFAFAGGKGGVGKTTTTANVAVALSGKGYDVGVVDADIGLTNLGAVLGVEAEEGIHEVLAGQASPSDVSTRGPADVVVVPGGDSLQATTDADPARLRQVVDPMAAALDVVLLDTGAGISHQNLVAYGLADAIALVTTEDHVAVGDAGKTGDLADRVDSPILGTVLTRVDADTEIEELPATLDSDVLAAVPEYGDRQAPEPRVLEDPESPAAREYDRLANTIAVCHQTGNFDDAAREASEELALPESPEDDPAEESTPESGVVGRVLSRLRIGR